VAQRGGQAATYRGFATVGRRQLVAKTCLTCGQLKDASGFRRTGRGYWQPSCYRCVHEGAKRSDYAAQARSQAGATRSGQPWTEADMLYVVTTLDSDEVAAGKLGRTIQAVRGQRHAAGGRQWRDIIGS